MSRSDELVRLHLLAMRRADFRTATIKERGENLRRAAEALPCELIEADITVLWTWQDALRDRVAIASVRCYTSHVKQFFRWAVREGHLEHDPTLELKTPKVAAGRANPVAEDALRVAMACAPDTTAWPTKTWLALAAYCGLRAGEIARLSRDSIGDDKLAVDGKGGKPREVPLPSAIKALLIAHVQGPGPIWRHRAGRPLTPDDVSHDCAKHLREAGAGCSLHKLRHRYATRLYRLSRDPMLVKELLGHGSLSTTQVYLGVSAEQGRKFANQLAESLSENRRPRRSRGDSGAGGQPRKRKAA